MNHKIQTQQPKYRLASDIDCNVFINLESADLESAALEALEILGYSILVRKEPVMDKSEEYDSSQ